MRMADIPTWLKIVAVVVTFITIGAVVLSE